MIVNKSSDCSAIIATCLQMLCISARQVERFAFSFNVTEGSGAAQNCRGGGGEEGRQPDRQLCGTEVWEAVVFHSTC